MSSIIDVVDDTECRSLCLFLAIGLTLKYLKIQAIQEKSLRHLKQSRFHRMTTKSDQFNKQRRIDLAKGLLQKIRDSGIEIDDTLSAYSIDEHLPLIQKYFDKLDDPDDRCRIIVFGQYGILRPMFKGSRRSKWNVPLFFHDGHFWGIRNLQ